MVGFDLGGVDAQEECKVGPHAEEEPNMDCESDGGEDGERVRLLPKPHTTSKAEWERNVVSHMPFRDWCRHCGREVLPVRSINARKPTAGQAGREAPTLPSYDACSG